jgi:hypothetical protein
MSPSPKFVIATMIRGRDPEEARRVLASLRVLAKFRVPIYVTDDLSSLPEFSAKIRRMSGVMYRQSGRSLAQRVKLAISRALRDSAPDFVFYTEPDKKEFFQRDVSRLLEFAAKHREAALIIPSRDHTAFTSFPEMQQRPESVFSSLAGNFTSSHIGDWLYGPMVLNPKLVQEYLDDVPDDLGWGWRIYLITRCLKAELSVLSYTGNFCCPQSQREQDEKGDIYRLQQLQENIAGLRSALQDALSEEK